jgi:hypothetical protein
MANAVDIGESGKLNKLYPGNRIPYKARLRDVLLHLPERSSPLIGQHH